jgi:hypothetical protein
MHRLVCSGLPHPTQPGKFKLKKARQTAIIIYGLFYRLDRQHNPLRIYHGAFLGQRSPHLFLKERRGLNKIFNTECLKQRAFNHLFLEKVPGDPLHVNISASLKNNNL